MIIKVQDVSKRYNEHWVIKKLSHTFDSTHIYGIKGDNGSGKSTLIKMISGFLSPTLGTITYVNDDVEIPRDDIYKHVSIWGPHTSMSGVLTVKEMIAYYGKMKGWMTPMTVDQIFSITELPVKIDQRVDQLSSGQAQRLGLTLTLLADTSVVLLDEPGSYLDQTAKKWMQDMISGHLTSRLALIASNDEADLSFASVEINLSSN